MSSYLQPILAEGCKNAQTLQNPIHAFKLCIERGFSDRVNMFIDFMNE